MSQSPESRIPWHLDGDAFASQIEHVEHVKWDDQASNEPPRFSLADDTMDCAWDDSGNDGSSVSDISDCKDPRRLTRSDVMDDFSSRWFGIDGFRNDGIEADAHFLGLIDEHASSQHQEQQPDAAESSQKAGTPAHKSPPKHRCDQAPNPRQAKRDRKATKTYPKPATRSEAVHIPMLPAVSTSLLSRTEGDDFETDCDPFQANKPETEPESGSQELFDMPSIDGVADAEFDSPEMQQYLFDLHTQEERARVAHAGPDECGHSSMAVDCPQQENFHQSNSHEDAAYPGQDDLFSLSSEAGSSDEDPVTDQQSTSDQVPSLVTGSTVETTTSSSPANKCQPRPNSGHLTLRGGDPNDGLSSYAGGILAAITNSENSLQGVSSEGSLSKPACISKTQPSADESLYDPFYPSTQHPFNNAPTSRQIGFRTNPAVAPLSETNPHTTLHQSNAINQYSYSPLSNSAHSDSQGLPIFKRSRCSKKRKQTHSGSPPNFQQSSPPNSPTRFASDTTPPTWQAQAFANDGSDFNPIQRSPYPPTSHDHIKTLGAARLDSHPTSSTMTFSPHAATPSPRLQKDSDELVIQKLEEMSRIIIADQRANARMERQEIRSEDQQADWQEAGNTKGWREQEPQDPTEESMDEKKSRLAKAREHVRGGFPEEAEDHVIRSKESDERPSQNCHCTRDTGNCAHGDGFCEGPW